MQYLYFLHTNKHGSYFIMIRVNTGVFIGYGEAIQTLYKLNFDGMEVKSPEETV